MAKNNFKPIFAVGYCRKSTNEERAEKSIADQEARIRKLHPLDDVAKYEIKKVYDQDLGVPGWKRGAKRPDYQRLVDELKETGATAILVDDMDRFSRADEFEVMHHVQELREHHGIRYIHAVNQGCIDLIGDQFAAMKIAMSAMASHEHCTRLSRGIVNARLDAALKGLRSGGEAPYGMYMADEHGNRVPPGRKKKGDPVGCILIPGDQEQVKVVRSIFDQFVNHYKSMHWIVGELNRKGIKARHGGKWHVATVTKVLKQRAYRGDFHCNEKQSGQFHIINENHEVVPVNRYQDEQRESKSEAAIEWKGRYKALIAPKVFDAAQDRLASFALTGRRPRENGYALKCILICDHCGRPMYGCHPTGRQNRVYRCSTVGDSGKGQCGNFWIGEEDILPFVLRTLGEEIDSVTRLHTPCPEELMPGCTQIGRANLENS